MIGREHAPEGVGAGVADPVGIGGADQTSRFLSMRERVQVSDAVPDGAAILTSDAEENRYMIDINESLGFRPLRNEAISQRSC